MSRYDDLLIAIQSHPEFPFLVEALRAVRPIVPSHDPVNDNTSLWKQKSAQQSGFDLCLNILKLPLE